MSLEDIKKKIISDAQNKAKQIEQENQGKISQLQAKAKEEINQKKQQILGTAKDKAKANLKSTLIEQKIKNNNEVLEEKRQIIDQIFARSLEQLNRIDDTSYRKLLKKQASKIQDLNVSDAKIITAPNKTALVKEVLADNKNLQNATYETSNEVSGGFLIKSTDSTIDLTFANLINENQGDLEAQINKTVFKD